MIDTEGKILASTFAEADQYADAAVAFVDSPADSQVIPDVSSSRFLTSIRWNTFCWLMETAMMFI